MEYRAAFPRHFWLASDELFCVAAGVAAVVAVIFTGAAERAPNLSYLCVLCVLSALSVHFSVAVDDDESFHASAQGMVIAAAVVVFRHDAALFGAAVVGAASAFWRRPRTRHEWFTIPGNIGLNGLAALSGAVVLGLFPGESRPGALAFALAGLCAAVAYESSNGLLVACYLRLHHGAP
ncbi:MAG TPA: hypothetical protein VL856_16955, partial [Acidimicrobiia bacterium]|nr:hypothetical protein [Acidimicrobiia bacterium]